MDQSTNFANSKRRVIRMSAKGVPFVMTAEGKKQYAPIAKFKKTPDGSMRVLKPTNKVPPKIAPASMIGRKKRANAGKARGPREGTIYRRVFGTPKPTGRKVRSNKGKPRQMVASVGGTLYKGKTAATRRKVVPKKMRTNPFASLMMM